MTDTTYTITKRDYEHYLTLLRGRCVTHNTDLARARDAVDLLGLLGREAALADEPENAAAYAGARELLEAELARTRALAKRGEAEWRRHYRVLRGRDPEGSPAPLRLAPAS